MSWMAAGTAAVGLVSGAGGAFLGGRAGDIQRKRLKNVANTPGLDIETLSQQALANEQKLLPGANALTRDEATARQALVNDLLEQSFPGFTAQRQNALGTADDFLSGNIPQDVSDQVQRSAAARSLGGGTAGSGFHRNLVARDLGLTSLGLKDKGLSWLSALRGMAPTVTPQSAFNFTGPNANDLINVRGQERAQRMNLLAQAAGIPGQTAAWANYLTQQGAAIEGVGLKGLGAGGFGGGGGAPSGSGGGQTIGNNPSGFVPYSGTYYAPGSRSQYNPDF
jgi:hypothetical protein